MTTVREKKPSWAKHIDFTVIDLVSLTVSFALAYWFKFGDLGFVDSASWKGLLAMLLAADLLVTFVTNPYSGVFRRGYWADVGASCRLALLSFLAACVVFYLMKIGEVYSREMLVSTYAFYLALSLTLKALRKRQLLARRENPPSDSVSRVVLAVPVALASEVEELALADDMESTKVVGFCLVDDGDCEECIGRPACSSTGISELAARVNADEIIVAVDPSTIGSDALEALIDDGVRVRFAIAESLGVKSENQELGRVGVMKTLDLERYSFGTGQLLYLPLKRAFDVVFGLFGCVLALPMAGVVKLCYLASGDNHPVIYRQQRIGLRGAPFEMFKFRTMVWDADAVLESLLEDPNLRADWELDQKLDNDPRVTSVGRILRRTSLDELPQFFNVVRGDMSVVGPRPLVPGELEKHGGRPLYNKVKPGVTGWWGCNGRSNIEYRERLELEYHYVRHCSLYLDVLCVFRTVAAVLKKDGAK